MGILTGDTTLMNLVANRVYLDAPHPDARPPFVLVTFYGASDTVGVGGARILSEVDYTARVVAKQADSSADTIALRIDTLLHKAAPNTALGVLGCVRQKPVSFLDDDKGVLLKHTGGIYRVYIV
jgi:hypothetical protein